MSFDVINRYANDLVAAAEKFEETLKAAQDSENTSYIRLVIFHVVQVQWRCGGWQKKNLQNFKNWMFRQLNEKIFRFERSFIDPHGLPDRLQFKHVIFAPSSSDTYSSAALPGLDSRLSVQNFYWSMVNIWPDLNENPISGLWCNV